MLKRSAAAAAMLILAQSPRDASGPVGVLVGIHRHGSQAEMENSRAAPSPGELRTVWLSVDGTSSQATSITIPDLLVPRRSGFWRVGLLGTCAEGPHLGTEDKPLGTEASVADYPWSARVGSRPTVRLPPPEGSEPRERVGRCRAREVACTSDSRTQVFWVWPDYLSLELGSRDDCGAHPDWGPGYTVVRTEDLAALSIADALGAEVQERFQEAFDAVEGDAKECGDGRFTPASWHIVREPGGWKAEGWSTTHRMCGYGFEFTADADLSAITGRADQRDRWRELTSRMPQLKDAHFLPGGEWILGTTKTEVLLFAAGTPDRPAARVPVSAYENVVMVEWATGPHVSRWAAEVRRARQAGRVQPLVR